MIDNLESNFSTIPTTALNNLHVDDLDVLNFDSDHWNGCHFDSGLSQWLDSVFVDGKNVRNSSNKLEEAKEDFNRVLEEWKCHQGNNSFPVDIELDDVISFDDVLLDANKEVDQKQSSFDNGFGNHFVPHSASCQDQTCPTDVLTPNEVDKILPLPSNDFVLEAFDVSSLLEQFEATEGNNQLKSTQEANGTFQPTCLPKDDSKLHNELHSISAQPRNESQLTGSFNYKRIEGKHVLPVSQLPRFSIILRRDPISVLEDCPLPQDTNLLEHDYCANSAVPQFMKKPVKQKGPSNGFVGREMKSVLRPQKLGNPSATLYSKIPDYYTALAKSPVKTETNECEMVESSEKMLENGCCNSVQGSLVGTCFDKLPSYITGLTAEPNCSSLNETKLPQISNCESAIHLEDNCENERDPYSPDMHAVNRRGRSCSHGKRRASSRSPSPAGPAQFRCRSQSHLSTLSSCSSATSDSFHFGSWQQDSKREDYHKKQDQYRMKTFERLSKDEWRRQQEIRAEEERKKQIEDRRVVHVGNISPDTSHEDIRKRFSVFGPIEKMTLHHREYGDWYAFITYCYKVDAYEALEHGNDHPKLPQYELSLGGRRLFCLEGYADLDSVSERNARQKSRRVNENFDDLLLAAKTRNT